jgi:hypothetical protein
MLSDQPLHSAAGFDLRGQPHAAAGDATTAAAAAASAACGNITCSAISQ